LRKRFEGEDYQGVTCQHRDRRAKFDMNGRLAAPKSRVVETGQIVVNERGAMQQFYCRRSGVGCCGIPVTAGSGHREAKLWSNTVTAGKDRITHGRGKEGWGARALGARDSLLQRCSMRSEVCMTAPFMCHLYWSFYSVLYY